MNAWSLLALTTAVSVTLACLGCGGSPGDDRGEDAAAVAVEQSGSLRRLAVSYEGGSAEAGLTADCLAGPYGPANLGRDLAQGRPGRVADQFEAPPPCLAGNGEIPVLDLEPGDALRITTGAPAAGVYVTLVKRYAGGDTFADAEPVGDSGQLWRVKVPEPGGSDAGPRLEIGLVPPATDSGGASFAVGLGR